MRLRTRTRTRTLQSLVPQTKTTTPPARRFAQVHDVLITTPESTGTFHEESTTKKTTDEASPGQMTQRNVFHQPLALHSTRPLTGYLRTGYCETSKTDLGNHSIAGIVTKEFLDFSASRGNDLRQAGLTEGCKWCLCVGRWKEAFAARRDDEDRVVPRVVLRATNERALEGVTMDELKKFGVDDGEAS